MGWVEIRIGSDVLWWKIEFCWNNHNGQFLALVQGIPLIVFRVCECVFISRLVSTHIPRFISIWISRSWIFLLNVDSTIKSWTSNKISTPYPSFLVPCILNKQSAKFDRHSKCRWLLPTTFGKCVLLQSTVLKHHQTLISEGFWHSFPCLFLYYEVRTAFNSKRKQTHICQTLYTLCHHQWADSTLVEYYVAAVDKACLKVNSLYHHHDS